MQTLRKLKFWDLVLRRYNLIDISTCFTIDITAYSAMNICYLQFLNVAPLFLVVLHFRCFCITRLAPLQLIHMAPNLKVTYHFTKINWFWVVFAVILLLVFAVNLSFLSHGVFSFTVKKGSWKLTPNNLSWKCSRIKDPKRNCVTI